MRATKTGEEIKALIAEAHLMKKAASILDISDRPDAQEMARKLKLSSSDKLELAEKLRSLARLENLDVYPVETERVVRKGETKTYTYWYASWRLGKKVRNVYIGSIRRMSHDEAFTKARKLKAEDLGIDL
ncbi:MAG TPA: hypothetical protein HA349_03025 [Methanotrichaceae archaeon]|nr:hypothetical protein [Methanotrichaceae archaeon]